MCLRASYTTAGYVVSLGILDLKLSACLCALAESPKVLVPAARIVGDRGWHHIQFVTDDQGPHNFVLKLEWVQDNRPRNDLGLDLIKVRTDVNVSTPEVAAVLERLPNCSLFGKSTSPYTLAYLDKITVNSI